MLQDFKGLRDKVAVITGGSGVLCREMAKELASQGMKVAILNRTVEKGQEVVDEIVEDGGTAIAVQCDVIDENSVKTAYDIVKKKLGTCNLLVNGAGGNHPDAITDKETYNSGDISDPDIKSFFDLELSGFDSVFRLNIIGSLTPTQVFARDMAEDGGTVINISSMSAPSPMTKVPAYSAAKSAIDNFTKWLSVHFAGSNIRINAIAPGFFLTSQNENLLLNEDGSYSERAKKIISQTPQERFGKPEDLLGTLLWLSDENYSKFVTGITVPVDGGFMAYSGV